MYSKRPLLNLVWQLYQMLLTLSAKFAINYSASSSSSTTGSCSMNAAANRSVGSGRLNTAWVLINGPLVLIHSVAAFLRALTNSSSSASSSIKAFGLSAISAIISAVLFVLIVSVCIVAPSENWLFDKFIDRFKDSLFQVFGDIVPSVDN